jgi:hypothetical protein
VGVPILLPSQQGELLHLPCASFLRDI